MCGQGRELTRGERLYMGGVTTYIQGDPSSTCGLSCAGAASPALGRRTLARIAVRIHSERPPLRQATSHGRPFPAAQKRKASGRIQPTPRTPPPSCAPLAISTPPSTLLGGLVTCNGRGVLRPRGSISLAVVPWESCTPPPDVPRRCGPSTIPDPTGSAAPAA